MRSVLLPLLWAGCTAGPADAVVPIRHIGPVTASVRLSDRTFSCSQVGVCEGVGSSLRLLADPTWRPLDLAVAPARDDRAAVLLVGGGNPARSGHVLLLDDGGRAVQDRRLADDLVYAVALAPDARSAAAACADGSVQLLAVPSLANVREPWRHGGPAVAVAFSPDGAWLASGGTDGKILLGAPADGDPRALLDHTAAVTCLAWSRDARLVSGASDGKVRLHDRGGRLLHTWQRLGGAVVALHCRDGEIECDVARGPDRPPVRTVLPLP